MRFPQVVVLESDGRLAHVLAGLVAEKRWVLRESRRIDACRRNLRTATPTVLVVALPASGVAELEFLGEAARLSDVRCVAVCTADEPVALPGLAWDLGADCVVSPPLTLNHLPEIVAGLMPGDS
jgi:hypothetical protein